MAVGIGEAGLSQASWSCSAQAGDGGVPRTRGISHEGAVAVVSLCVMALLGLVLTAGCCRGAGLWQFGVSRGWH